MTIYMEPMQLVLAKILIMENRVLYLKGEASQIKKNKKEEVLLAMIAANALSERCHSCMY